MRLPSFVRRPQRQETLIALRARREAYQVASSLLYEPINLRPPEPRIAPQPAEPVTVLPLAYEPRPARLTRMTRRAFWAMTDTLSRWILFAMLVALVIAKLWQWISPY